MIGFPSVGKSTLLSKLTATSSETGAYEFTTLTCIPGNIMYRDAKIQLLDLPGIIEGAAGGKGRGKQVIAVARTADLILFMLDASKGEIQRNLLEKELLSCGIRMNVERPVLSEIRKPRPAESISRGHRWIAPPQPPPLPPHLTHVVPVSRWDEATQQHLLGAEPCYALFMLMPALLMTPSHAKA